MTQQPAPGTGGADGQRSRCRQLGTLLLCGAGLVALLHAANLTYVAESLGCNAATLACHGDTEAWAARDTRTYLRVARSLLERGPIETPYLSRLPGYPALIAASLRLTGEITPVLWLGPLLAGLAAAAIGWITFALTSRLGAALAALALFGGWLGAYRFSAQLLTDAPHAFVCVAAVAATLAWRRNGAAAAAGLAGAAWMAAQTLRPTFFPIALLLPLLLHRSGASRRYLVVSVALWLSTLFVPGLVLLSNHHHYGVWSPSDASARNLACYAVPRLQQELGEGSFHALRRQCQQRYAGMDPAVRIAAQRRDALAKLGEHPYLAARSFLREIEGQVFAGMKPFAVDATQPLYPPWLQSGSGAAMLFWLCALGGLLVLARRGEKGLTLFWIAAFWLVMLPAGASHGVRVRLRLPVDLLFIPVAVLFLQTAAEAGWRRLARARDAAATPQAPVDSA